VVSEKEAGEIAVAEKQQNEANLFSRLMIGW